MRRLVVCGLCALFAFQAAAASEVKVVDKVLASVNDRPLFLSEYKERYEETVRQITRQYDGAARGAKVREAKKNLFQAILREEILLARAGDIGVDEEHVIEQYKEEFKTQNKIESDEDLVRNLEREGLTLSAFKEQIRRAVIPQIVIRRDVSERIEVTDEQARAYYERHADLFRQEAQVKLGTYFIAMERENAEDTAFALAERLQGGVARPDLVREFGLDAWQGYPETRRMDDLLPELERVAFALPPGTASDPIPTEHGYYILHVFERSQSEMRPFEEVKEDIYERVRGGSFDSETEEYLKELRETYFVEVYDSEPERFLD
ncbi:MAG: peptidyl-prolyl cis-trans isomerase [Acidobacteriota bacterium]|nr:MAG: peptidyl-prolyl cis-trans isomerase [Acidobacteriota bacterium]